MRQHPEIINWGKSDKNLSSLSCASQAELRGFVAEFLWQEHGETKVRVSTQRFLRHKEVCTRLQNYGAELS